MFIKKQLEAGKPLLSGNPTANVFDTGVYTIPLIKNKGYKPAFAGALEADASTGGQILPPVMGVSVFILMALLGMGYIKIVSAAIPIFIEVALFLSGILIILPDWRLWLVGFVLLLPSIWYQVSLSRKSAKALLMQ